MDEKKTGEVTGLTPVEVMGLFWMALGIMMFIAAFFPEDTIGKMVNLGAGGAFAIIGLIAWFGGKRSRKSAGGE